MFRQFFDKHGSTLKYWSYLAAVFSVGLAVIGFDHASNVALQKNFDELETSVYEMNALIVETNATTNALIVETNATTNALIVETNAATNALIVETNAATNALLDETDALLDELTESVNELTESVNALAAAVSELLAESKERESSASIAPDETEGHAKDISSRIQPLGPDAGSLARSGLSNCASRANAGVSGPKAWVAPVKLFRRAELPECRTTRSD